MGQVFLMGGSGGIDVEGADATTEQVLNGVKFYSDENEGDEILVGSMPNNGKVEQTLNAGGTYTIPAGYHNGEGYVKAKDLAPQTSATATSEVIQSGYTAWVNGNKVTGTYSKPTQCSASNKSLGYSESVTYYSGYYPNTWSVTAPAAGGVTRGAAGSCSRSTSNLASGTDTNIRVTWNNIGFTPRYLNIMIGNISQSGASGNNVSVFYYNGTNLSFYNAGGNSNYSGRVSNISSTGCTITFTIPGGWDAGTISGRSYFIAAS